MSKILFGLGLLLTMFGITQAQALPVNGYNYFRVCISGNACVITMITQSSGESVVLFPEGQSYPGLGKLIDGGVKRDAVSGEWIGGISASKLAALVAGGIETMQINPDDLQKEIDAAQGALDDNLIDCLVSTSLCGGGAITALGTGGLGLSLAGIVCYQTYRQCKALDKANKDLFKKRDEAKAQLKKYALEKTAEANGGGSSSGGTGLPPGGVFTGVNPGPNIPGSVYKCQGTAVNTVEAGVDTSPDANIICGWVYENQ